jgi:hypothetical protein
VPLVIKPAAFACRAERLAWAGAGPDWLVVSDAGTSKGCGPQSDPGKEVDLPVGQNVVRCEVENRSPLDSAGRDLSGADEVFEPVRGEVVDLVVEREVIHDASPCRAWSCLGVVMERFMALADISK